MDLRAPFPWFGGKSRAAAVVWDLLGDVDYYVEPFAGSLAVLLGRPGWSPDARWAEVVNDLDGMIANFWRALALHPEAVVKSADWPIVQVDMRARWDALEAKRIDMVDRLRADPAWCDPEAAGWWVWGQSASVGANWLHGYDARPQLPRSLGVHSNDGLGRLRSVAERMRRVSVWCCDWSLCVTPAAMGGRPGIFLDPPYGGTRKGGCYREDSTTVHEAVTAWARTADATWRIVVAGFDGEHDALDGLGWTRHAWSPPSGMQARAPDGRGRQNRLRETLWASPSCVPQQRGLFAGVP